MKEQDVAELEAKKAHGPLRPEDEAILGFLAEEGVRTIDRKHATSINF